MTEADRQPKASQESLLRKKASRRASQGRGRLSGRASLDAGRWPLLGATRRVVNLFFSYFLLRLSRPQATGPSTSLRTSGKPRLGGASNGCPVRMLLRTRTEAKGRFQRENGRPICFTIAPVKRIAISSAPNVGPQFAPFASSSGRWLGQTAIRKRFTRNCARKIRRSLKILPLASRIG